MSSPLWTSLAKRTCFLCGIAIFAVGSLSAQSASSSANGGPSLSADESSSAALQPATGIDPSPGAAVPAAPAAGGSGKGQQYDAASHHGILSNLAFEAGAGANAPIGNDGPYITWGGNFSAGVGKHFGHGTSLLAEYQFMDNKLPGSLIADVGTQGGNAHIWSLTLAPVIDLMPKRSTAPYVTGGFGFYRKVTNFTDPVEGEVCYYYCGIVVENETVYHFSSNQWGGNLGVGLSHRLGGTYGDGQAKIFAEARYLFINTPAVNTTNGTGTTELIPVTFGVRW